MFADVRQQSTYVWKTVLLICQQSLQMINTVVINISPGLFIYTDKLILVFTEITDDLEFSK